MARGKKIEFINHFKLSRVGTRLLIYCQVVTWSVISALGPRRNRHAVGVAIAPWRENSGQYKGAAEGRKEAALVESSCILLPAGGRDWSVTLPRQRILHGCQIYCFWQQSNAFMSHLSSYHFFQFFYHQCETTDFPLLPFDSCACCLFPDCRMSNVLMLIGCCPVTGSGLFVTLPKCCMGSIQLSLCPDLSLRRAAGRFRCWSTCVGI